MNDISFSSPVLASAGRPVPVNRPQDATRASAPAPEVSIPKVALAPLPKAEIHYDAEKSRATLQQAVSQMNEMMRDGGRALSFSIDEKAGAPVVVVKNDSTGEVIRQIPSPVALKIAYGIEDFKGLLHSKVI